MRTAGKRAARNRGGKPILRLSWLWWALGWVIVLFVTISCLEPARYVPDLHVNDKLEHAGAFFGMTVWFGGLVARTRYLWVALWMLLFGAGIEVAQGMMNLGRDADIRDFLADAAGIAVALVLLNLGLGQWPRWFERIFRLARERT